MTSTVSEKGQVTIPKPLRDSLGLVPGTELRVVRYAPLGDPIEIEFRGAHLVLRPKEAFVLELERV